MCFCISQTPPPPFPQPPLTPVFPIFPVSDWPQCPAWPSHTSATVWLKDLRTHALSPSPLLPTPPPSLAPYATHPLKTIDAACVQEVAADHALQTCRSSANMMSKPASTSKPTQARIQRRVRTSAAMLLMSASWGQSSSSTQKSTPQTTPYHCHRCAIVGLSGEADMHVGSQSFRLAHLDCMQCRQFNGIAVSRFIDNCTECLRLHVVLDLCHCSGASCPAQTIFALL